MGAAMGTRMFADDCNSDDYSPGDVLSEIARERYEKKIMREARLISKGAIKKPTTAEHLHVVLDRLSPRRCTASVPF